MLRTPWGDLPADVAPPPLVQADAAPESAPELHGRAAPVLPGGRSGRLHRGRVSARRFRGDHVLLLLDVPGAPPLHVEAREGELPAVGATVRLAVRPGGVHVIRGASALPFDG